MKTLLLYFLLIFSINFALCQKENSNKQLIKEANSIQNLDASHHQDDFYENSRLNPFKNNAIILNSKGEILEIKYLSLLLKNKKINSINISSDSLLIRKYTSDKNINQAYIISHN